MRNKHTQQTLAKLKAMGADYYIAEHWKPGHPKEGEQQANPKKRHGVRVDAFGFGDIDAVFPAPPEYPFEFQRVFIQSTAWNSISARRKKILTECATIAYKLLKAGTGIQIWGWKQIARPGLTKAGKPRKGKMWVLKIEEITKEHFPGKLF